MCSPARDTVHASLRPPTAGAAPESAQGKLKERLLDNLADNVNLCLMAATSDGFVALPGGLGTLEELAEVASWAQLGLHAKPIGLLGPAGYWDGLLGWLDHAVAEGFIAPGHRGLVGLDPDLEALLERFGWRAPS